MRVLIAPQEFKGSLTAVQAAAAIERGVQQVFPNATTDSAPVADGGPGTVEAIVHAANGRTSIARVDGPLGAPVDARWGRIDNGRTAVIEMAAASGLTLLRAEELDPRRASTYGTGQLIKHALDAGVERILIGVGGSATNDGGAGMAEALGAVLLDEHGNRLPPGGAALANLARIQMDGFDARLTDVEMTVLCDVQNPLLGAEGRERRLRTAERRRPRLRRPARPSARQLRRHPRARPRRSGCRDSRRWSRRRSRGWTAGLLRRDAAIRLRRRLGGGQPDPANRSGRPGDHRRGTARRAVGLRQDSRRRRRVGAEANAPCVAVAGLIEGSPTLPGLVDCEASTPEGMSVDEAMARADELVPEAVERLLRRYSR